MAQPPWLVVVAASVLAHGSAGSGDPDAMFQYRTYEEMVQTMMALNASHPDVVDLFVAQDKYGLPYPTDLQCGEEHGVAVPCKQYVLRITNESTWDGDRPEVFFSGALHGNERVGPQATMELALLLVDYATSFAAGSTSSDSTNVRRSKAWLHRLVNSRSIYMMPMTNSHGYYHNKREENGVDPNRDYNYKTNGNCMQAMTSRAVNELWRDHMFQLAVTFHGGMRCVTYEWGAPNHMDADSARSERSPDDTSQAALASALSTFAGKFPDGTYYPTGTMNDVVYGVYGGMEDWAYAASWENEFASRRDSAIFAPCAPTQYGEYPPEKTSYNNMTHRAFNLLVETSDSKHPVQSALGLRSSIYDVDLEAVPTAPVGHVVQNVRLGLLVIDMVQPYIVWQPPVPKHTSHKRQLTSTVAGCPLSDLHVVDCDASGPMSTCAMAITTTHVRVRWDVLGSFTVDETFVQVSTDAAFDTGQGASPVLSGVTRRQRYVDKVVEDSQSISTAFAACVPVSSASSTMFLRAQAKVDQGWAFQKAAVSPHVPPQSHVVNARTNPQYNRSP
ncbi:hypothetical protein, variant 2 [Aphanomyces invadans]|uniref:Peptidase M14 domain-containing protein n=1 Tax=Aphanomyces invadans TaxID=157072 RepID=A0A024TFK8_9STRA|nr:hypothetical protein, variant 1 [Aphanomyces invadans]XP_008878570.1 hypothetical protein, variant 2 [Aphanomyces invadans]ETV92799.1 hypothetical protein, variant 1 [Aphanomyces invadans]ETV92800.1 hypothetical protein, variant 2 [Aphanomyces invadans]|eukprot:XP_008878569.1 hypothetical protein, variant 1 [Aphanomyces invadans]